MPRLDKEKISGFTKSIRDAARAHDIDQVRAGVANLRSYARSVVDAARAERTPTPNKGSVADIDAAAEKRFSTMPEPAQSKARSAFASFKSRRGY